MKTNKVNRKGFRFLKNLVVLSMIAFIAASCGQENQSGQSSNNDVFGNFGNYGTINGTNISQAIAIVARENNCINFTHNQFGNQQINPNAQRTRIRSQIQGVNVNIGAIHLGVSSFGDIAVIGNENGAVYADIYACQRPGMSGQVQQASNIIIRNSSFCPIAEIESGYFSLSTQYGVMNFGLSPIHIPGTNRVSSLCNGNLNGQF
jgi:hypothetical protein